MVKLRCIYLILIALALLGQAAPANSQSAVEVPYVQSVEVSVDGAIEEGEYAAMYLDRDTGMEVHMTHDGQLLYVGLVSPWTGWVAVGFGHVGIGMDGANIIIGFIDDATNTLHISDEKGVKHSHKPDTELGGEYNVLKAAGQQDDGTIIEFIIPIDSGDDQDYPMKIGRQYGMILAYSKAADDFESYHSARIGSLIFELLEAEAEGVPQPPKATYLYVESADSQLDEVLKIHYILLDEDGNLLGNAPIDIYLNYSLGVAHWDTVFTDEHGRTYSEIVTKRSGLYKILAIYKGESRFLPSNYTYTFSRYVEYESIPKDPFYNWGLWVLNRPHDKHMMGMSYEKLPEWIGSIFTSQIKPETPFSLLVLVAIYGTMAIAYSFLLFVVYCLYRIWMGKREK